MEVLRERDQKGLYSKLENGKIKNVSGMDLQVEFPKTPDITVRNDGSRTVADVVKEIMGSRSIDQILTGIRVITKNSIRRKCYDKWSIHRKVY